MARTRNLKPGFFKNEYLAKCSPHARLLYAGLWCWADCLGRIEDRPERIKAEIFPYEGNINIKSLLNELIQLGFVVRYKHDASMVSVSFLLLPTLVKHQNFNTKENPSNVFNYKDIDECTVQAPYEHDADTMPAQPYTLHPTPLNPIPINPHSPQPVDNVDNLKAVGFNKSLVEREGYRMSAHTLNDEVLNNARKKAPSWDIYHLQSIFEESVRNGKHPVPTNEAGAFIAWCGKYTKGRKP